MIRSVLFACVLCVSVTATAQTVPVVPQSGTAANGAPVSTRADVAGAIGTKLDGPVSSEAITVPNPGIAHVYLGGPTFPQPGRVPLVGHLQISGNLGAWGSQTNALSVVPNATPGAGLENAGNQGGFWDPAYRTAYDGQDQAAIYVWMRARKPVLVAGAVSSFGTAQIATPLGNRTVYTVTLSTPLTAAQRADMTSRPPNLRVETGNGFYGYTIPSGFLTPAGAPLLPVSADGATVVVDVWARVRPTVVSGTAGAVPSGFDAAPYTLTIDATHQINTSYGGWRIADDDLVTVAMGEERVFINAKSSIPALNLYDPLTTGTLTVGTFMGVVNDLGAVGQGTAAHVCTAGWQACFVARNQPSGPSTFGFLAPFAGPTWGYYSTQGTGYVLASDPGNSCGPAGQQATPGAPCVRAYLLDTAGNSSQTGAMSAAAVNTPALKVSGTARVDGSFGVRTPDGTGQTAYIDGATGQIITRGFIVPGSFTVATLPGCSTVYLGAHIYVTNARKPGEAAGAGSGAPADCTPLSPGAAPVYASVYDRAAVVQ